QGGVYPEPSRRKGQVDGPLDIVPAENFPENAIGISIGPKTIAQCTQEINHAKTVFLNCAMGFADRPETRQSTKSLIEAMAQSEATTIIAGGDSVDIAVETPDNASISHLSSGVGAALAYLFDVPLPGCLSFEEE